MRERSPLSPSRWMVLLVAFAAILVAAAAYSVASTHAQATLPPSRSAASGNLTPAQQLWQNLATAEKNGQYDEALEYSRLLREQHGEYYLVNLRAGWLHYLKKDYVASLEAYRRASLQAPGSVSAMQGIASCLVELGQPDQAIQTTNALLAIDPMNYPANRRLADLNYQKKNFARAEVYYLKLSSLYPEDLDVAVQLAWCYHGQARMEAALAVFQSILIAAPNHASARLGWNACQPAAIGKETP